MKKTFFALTLSFFSVLACVANNEPDPKPTVVASELNIERAASALCNGGFPRVEGATASRYGALLRTEITVSASNRPLDSFKFQRTARIGRQPKAILLLLPSRNCNAAEYEWSDKGEATGGGAEDRLSEQSSEGIFGGKKDAFQDSFVGFLASNGVEVWGYSPRTTNLPENFCQTHDCSVAKDWGMDAYLEDIAFIRNVIRVLHPRDKPFIGGLSLGTILGYAAINARPSDFAGLVAWENAILSNDSEFKAGFASVCAADEQALAEGKYVDDNFGSLSRLALRLFQSNPEGASPLPFFPGFNNRQAFVGLFSLPAPGVPIPQRGFVIQAGDPFGSQQFTYTNFYRASKMLEVGNYYESQRLIRDFDCSFSGSENRFSKNLKNFTGPVLLIKEGLGFGEYTEDSVSALGSTDVARVSNPLHAHADSFLEVNHRQNIDKTILHWLLAHAH